MALPAILAAFLMLLTTQEPERGATEDALKVRAEPVHNLSSHAIVCKKPQSNQQTIACHLSEPSA